MTTAKPLANAKDIAVQNNKFPFNARDIVSYPTPIICGNFIAISPRKAPAKAGLDQLGMRSIF